MSIIECYHQTIDCNMRERHNADIFILTALRNAESFSRQTEAVERFLPRSGISSVLHLRGDVEDCEPSRRVDHSGSL